MSKEAKLAELKAAYYATDAAYYATDAAFKTGKATDAASWFAKNAARKAYFTALNAAEEESEK